MLFGRGGVNTKEEVRRQETGRDARRQERWKKTDERSPEGTREGEGEEEEGTCRGERQVREGCGRRSLWWSGSIIPFTSRHHRGGGWGEEGRKIRPT
jgi:hypothetical protein